MKQIPFVDFPKDKELDAPLSDGLYAVISHNPGFYGRGRRALVPNAFPWRTTIYEFKGGIADERGSGSNTGDMLSRWNVTKAFLIGLDSHERLKLDETLAEHGIKLIPDLADEVEKKRARDSLGPGFHLA